MQCLFCILSLARPPNSRVLSSTKLFHVTFKKMTKLQITRCNGHQIYIVVRPYNTDSNYTKKRMEMKWLSCGHVH